MFTADITRFLVMVALFGAVFLLAQVLLRVSVEEGLHAGAINKRLKLIAKGADRQDIVSFLRKNDPMVLADARGWWVKAYVGLRRNLTMAAVPYSTGHVAVAMGAIFAVLIFGIAVASWNANYPLSAGVMQIIIAFSAATAIGVPLLVISFLAQRRRRRMQEQFPVALDIFVRALRSGHPIAGAMDLLTKEMDDPIGSEFGLVSDEVSYGAELTDSLNDMAERWDLDDIRMFVVSLSVQNETGGNLAEILDNLSKVIRERASLYLKVRALSSEGRMTGWLLVALPVFTFVSLFTSNPKFYLDVARDPIFYIGFPLMLIWYFIGVLAIRKMINLKV
jgi:tight adherence protein B